ncbi:MAG: phosphotransferase [Candidatus Lambdaproteobacteria bacterium]|nr:phosphotransferase [Candidatus Lambdaproteobacteria bacterium]
MTPPPRSEVEALRAFAARLLGKGAGAAPAPVERLRGGGSERRFYRLSTGAGSVIGVVTENAAELRTLLAFTRHFAGRGIPVPRLYGADEARGLYLMEDLGPTTLAEQIEAWRNEHPAGPEGGARALAALEQVVRWLPVIQVRGGAGLDYRLCPGGERLGLDAYRADLARFTGEYVTRYAPAGAPPEDVAAELEALARRCADLPAEHFCYRDYQTRNIMWRGGAPVFIDYQSGRRGPLQYDLASLLYSPDSALDDGSRGRLIEVYLEALAGCGVAPPRAPFLHGFDAVVLVRRLQALGAYGQLAARGKPEYGRKIAPALADLRMLLAQGRATAGLPALAAWLERVIGPPG